MNSIFSKFEEQARKSYRRATDNIGFGIKKMKSSKSSSVCLRCSNCSYETSLSSKAMKSIAGASLVGAGAYGWVNYTFAGLLGFYGGAALIAGALITGGVVVLSRDNSELIHKVGTKIADALSKSDYNCEQCNASEWHFSGYGENKVISGTQHIEELDNSINNVKDSIIIVSGFMSSYVVNRNFVDALHKRLEADVAITLVFPNEEEHSRSSWMRRTYLEGLSNIELLNRYPKFSVIFKHTHQKGIIVDNDYAIVGSYNFLMNSKGVKSESSIKVFDAASIQEFRNNVI